MDLDGQRGWVVEGVAAVPGSETVNAIKRLGGRAIARWCDGRRGSARANVWPSGGGWKSSCKRHRFEGPAEDDTGAAGAADLRQGRHRAHQVGTLRFVGQEESP